MIQAAEALLHNMVLVAEEQLRAAKKMDAFALQEATAKRQDLLFELELEKGQVVPSEEITVLQEKLENIEYNLRLESLNSRLENLHDTTTTNKNKLYLAWENEWLRKKVEELSK